MKVAVLGAAGKLGRWLVERCLARGHEVTAAMRDPDRFRSEFTEISPALRVATFDIRDAAALDAALAGQDAVISAAGNIADGEAFVDLFDRVATAAERVLGSERRVWMLAGAGVLDIPGTGRIGVGLPFVPKIYGPHLQNWRRLQRSGLDWALMCPGQMVAGDPPPAPEDLRISVDALPIDVGSWARYAPPLALSLVLKGSLPRLAVPYLGVADLIADNLEPGGRFQRKRVGIGWAESRGAVGKRSAA